MWRFLINTAFSFTADNNNNKLFLNLPGTYSNRTWQRIVLMLRVRGAQKWASCLSLLSLSSCILFSIAGSLNLHTIPHIKPPGCVIPSVRHVLHTSSPETTEIYCLPALLRAHFQTFWLRFNLLCVWSQPSQLWSLAYSSKGTLLRRCTGVWSYQSRERL